MGKREKKPRPAFMIDHAMYKRRVAPLPAERKALLMDALAEYSEREAQYFFDGVADAQDKAYREASKMFKGDEALEAHFGYLVDAANRGIIEYESQTHGGRPPADKGDESG